MKYEPSHNTLLKIWIGSKIILKMRMKILFQFSILFVGVVTILSSSSSVSLASSRRPPLTWNILHRLKKLIFVVHFILFQFHVLKKYLNCKFKIGSILNLKMTPVLHVVNSFYLYLSLALIFVKFFTWIIHA